MGGTAYRGGGDVALTCGGRRGIIITIVYRFAAIILVLCYAALGSGAVESLHNAHHATEDARLAALQDQRTTPTHPTHHDENNCPVHLQLHLSVMAVGWVPLLICLGLFVAFLTELPVSLPPQQRCLVISCRGPPVC
jgi:hypothetical protein